MLADELLYSDGGTVKKVGLDNFIELAPTLATEDAIANGDYILFLDGGATGNMNKEAVADFATLLAGTGISASASVLSIDASTDRYHIYLCYRFNNGRRFSNSYRFWYT